MGLKAIAIYRDGSKRTQPLTTGMNKAKEKDQAVEKVVYKPLRRRLSGEREAMIHKFTVASNEGYLIVGLYEDGSPGEIFVVMAKEGSTISGLMDAFSTSISLALQYGVPLKVLVNKFIHTRFEPSGVTNNPEIRFAKSIVDYIFRWLGLRFLSKEDQDAIGLAGTVPETNGSNGNGAMAQKSAIVEKKSDQAVKTSTAIEQIQGKHEPELITFDPQSDAPSCDNCGMIMVRNGSCYKCLNCGSTSGCG
jgi:ribonucleoside-diphosphate reductase alpha chain